MFFASRFWILAALGLAAAGTLLAEGNPPTLAAVGDVPFDALDCEGETLGGFGSGLAYDAKADRWLAVADRGPGDGTIDYRPRFQTLRVDQPSSDAGSSRLVVTVETTTIFLDADGKPFTGHLPDAAASTGEEVPRYNQRVCLDPEAIALAPDGTLYVGEEYGPFVYQFRRDGHFLRRLAPPAAYRPRDDAGRLSYGEDAVTGRKPNHGFEGLAISPDGTRVTVLLQGPLLQDGGRKGSLTRLLVFDAASGEPCAEYAYAFESSEAAEDRLKLSKADKFREGEIQGCELLAVDAHRFLLLERDGRGWNEDDPRPAAAKSVWLVDIERATDLLAHPAPSPLRPAPELALPAKTLLIDLVASGWRAMAPKWPGLAAKWEGLALQRREGNQCSLLVSSDNDFINPVLRLEGRDVSFPKARRGVDTQFLLFTLDLPAQ